MFAAGVVALAATPAFAQFARRPFAVGGEGGGGASGGLTGWIMETQSLLTRLIAGDVKALHDNPAAIWGLVGIGFLYGVIHAAGPGHGKAVIASYMMASDRALKRGVILSFLAALLQGTVAVALVGAAALIFNATAAEMNAAADGIALASYGGVIAIGLWLTWTKGRALIAALRARFAHREALAAAPIYAGVPWRRGAGSAGALSLRAYAPTRRPPPDRRPRWPRAATATRWTPRRSRPDSPRAAPSRPSSPPARGPACIWSGGYRYHDRKYPSKLWQCEGIAMDFIHDLIGRQGELFAADLEKRELELCELVRGSRSSSSAAPARSAKR